MAPGLRVGEDGKEVLRVKSVNAIPLVDAKKGIFGELVLTDRCLSHYRCAYMFFSDDITALIP
ncbi:hypothetical protein TSA66_00075 [Noviherbaspirillum autotrophicum]|uniref:Uncharacterized protein n=1 Tax=Noviherbaspirillum autotrophicum TaxID=709839 RepID=A0A0C2BVV7_9BURK|nr:hypothetical protein TSA66_20805 [Noviherbaspirillum autotrophicum]KIF84164.1 hypothetical protein TSA66_00075 [Noviherbaspirillum autotrophicum]